MIRVNQDKMRAIVEGKVRAERDSLLSQCDWTQGVDVPAELSDKWKPYRQALRDITSQEGFPFNVEWPVKP